jgi:hypothetical protein
MKYAGGRRPPECGQKRTSLQPNSRRSAYGTQPPSNGIKRDNISQHTLSTTQHFEATIGGVKFVSIKE